MRRSDPLPVPSRRRDRASLEDGGRGCPSERALRGRCRQGVSGNCAPSYPSWWRLLLANGLGGQCYRLTNSDIQSLARKAHEFQQAVERSEYTAFRLRITVFLFSMLLATMNAILSPTFCCIGSVSFLSNMLSIATSKYTSRPAKSFSRVLRE